ncbi:uncharacterized protein BP5553_05865 [Venustampulla echinocandica]|uniref:Smr domain-containing protein n=1 Tax=Venustampulla echinocandica TaxID=2656787 RepID=A0A370TLW3_9HELO|nr:uncharacterized protein BP5553_05865 [Venustampulla echinocandica]RDL36513.1 hypothetical protein BP5553_05865 [Venustampulla echinocandica]
MAATEAIQAQLLDEYSKTIDPATLLAIISDYDICDTAQLSAARQTLDILKATVPDEEATGFDASGASGPSGLIDVGEEGGEDGSQSGSGKSLPGWMSQTDTTSISQRMSSLDLEGLDFSSDGAPTGINESGDRSYTSELDSLDDGGKEAGLRAIFPILKPFDIQWTLKKCRGDPSLAIDELMTQSFLEENGGRQKGIDAFSESDIPSRPRKHKAKKKRERPVIEGAGGPEAEPPPQSKWETGTRDIDFIVSKLDMPKQQVASLYHKNGASVASTLSAIIQAHNSMNVESDDATADLSAFEIQQDFPSISISDLAAIVLLTHHSLDNARAVAKALTYTPYSNNKSPIQIQFRHTPINVESEPPPPVESPPQLGFHYESPGAAAARANSYVTASNSARRQAEFYARKGKSDPLMGGAAAHYSSEARSYSTLANKAASVAADALVAAQSSRTELDLHGVVVKDAVRISREKVTAWWHGLRNGSAGGPGVGGGYRIVTGLGRHSEGGKGKLGPAVGKMLIREGWRVEVGSGVLVVRGVQPTTKKK